MDAYDQYARWRVTKRLGLRNRRLAGMLGDFLYETSSAEDESRRILELLYARGKQTLTVKGDLRDLERFTSEHNREQRRSDGVKEAHVTWGRMDRLSQEIIRILSQAVTRTDSDFINNLAALDRMFSTTEALRQVRNQVDHRAPSDEGGRLHFYRDTDAPVTARTIWGWTEVAASYWTNLTSIGNAISVATGIDTLAWRSSPQSTPLQWPPADTSIHGLRVLQESGIAIPRQQVEDARKDWARVKGKWNGKRP